MLVKGLKILTVLALTMMVVMGFVFFRGDLSREELAEYVNEESAFIDLPMGANLHYRDQGNPDGPAIVLIHGGFGSLHNWEVWVPYLKDDYRVVTMDLPAHGLTGRVKSDRYTRQEMIRSVYELVEELGISKFTIGGHSMGGGVALEYALDIPDQVTSLILVGTEGIPPEGGYQLEGTFIEDDVRLQGVLDDKSLSLLEWLFTKFSLGAVTDKALQSLVAKPESVTPELMQNFGRILRHDGNRFAVTLMFRQFTATTDIKDDLVPRLGELTQPTLLLYGDQDTLVPTEAAERAHRLIANSVLKIYEDVGHLIQFEATEQTANDVLYFLKTLDANGRAHVSP